MAPMVVVDVCVYTRHRLMPCRDVDETPVTSHTHDMCLCGDAVWPRGTHYTHARSEHGAGRCDQPAGVAGGGGRCGGGGGGGE